MALYSLESPKSLQRVAGNPVAVDTSYLVSLSDTTHQFFNLVSTFHLSAQSQNTEFIISVIVRQEFIKMVRKNLFVSAMHNLASNDPSFSARYRQCIGQSPTSGSISMNYEKIVKDHIKNHDIYLLLQTIQTDIWQETQRLEKQAGVYYMSGMGSISWDDLGALMHDTGIASPDGMIANMAMYLEIESILTTDCDYASIAHEIDVYMPLRIAQACKSYDPLID